MKHLKRLIILVLPALSVTFPAMANEPEPLVLLATEPLDSDGDGVLDAFDNCRLVENLAQIDVDGDGIGDPCDPDRDGDSVYNVLDNCPSLANAEQLDSNLDGIGDRCEATVTARLSQSRD